MKKKPKYNEYLCCTNYVNVSLLGPWVVSAQQHVSFVKKEFPHFWTDLKAIVCVVSFFGVALQNWAERNDSFRFQTSSPEKTFFSNFLSLKMELMFVLLFTKSLSVACWWLLVDEFKEKFRFVLTWPLSNSFCCQKFGPSGAPFLKFFFHAAAHQKLSFCFCLDWHF